jgi:hypothetical protein
MNHHGCPVVDPVLFSTNEVLHNPHSRAISSILFVQPTAGVCKAPTVSCYFMSSDYYEVERCTPAYATFSTSLALLVFRLIN